MLFHPNPSPTAAHRAPPARHWPPAWASAWGDDRYGLWAELEVSQIVQRFRWIEPGSFLMGSPDTEHERSRDEGPQHPVTMTQGFWLADTACTQALWLALVGGDNPSGLTSNLQLPVEQVSWNNVTRRFLPKLQALLPADTKATLPTEAQWEYACRAGTSTPFSWGDTIHPGLVNYDGNRPYNGGLKGEYRRRTVPVLSLPANDWGLHQMHGNVSEWCLDEARDYAKGTAINPTRTVRDGRPVLRGGSWFDHAGFARSAYRRRNHRDARLGGFGFRVALKFK
jgi:formylglycine-generating enzyme required for sulfatase activity